MSRRPMGFSFFISSCYILHAGKVAHMLIEKFNVYRSDEFALVQYVFKKKVNKKMHIINDMFCRIEITFYQLFVFNYIVTPVSATAMSVMYHFNVWPARLINRIAFQPGDQLKPLLIFGFFLFSLGNHTIFTNDYGRYDQKKVMACIIFLFRPATTEHRIQRLGFYFVIVDIDASWEFAQDWKLKIGL